MSLMCSTCQVSVNSQWQYQQHLSGKSHARKVKQLSGDGQVPGAQNGNGTANAVSSHPLVMRKIQKAQINFVKAADGSEPQADGPSEAVGPAESAGLAAQDGEVPLFCSLCSVELNSKDQALVHYRGAKHFKKEKAAQMHAGGGVPKPTTNVGQGHLYCGFCNTTVNSAQQMTLHREGSKHKRMVEGRKRQAGQGTENQPVKKRAAFDPTSNIPQVDSSQILPFSQVMPMPSATGPSASSAAGL